MSARIATSARLRELQRVNEELKRDNEALRADVQRLAPLTEELLLALIGEHDALDLLLAERIVADPTFRPTKWIKWPAMVAGNAAILKARA